MRHIRCVFRCAQRTCPQCRYSRAVALEQVSIIPGGTVVGLIMILLGVRDFPSIDSIFNSLYFFGLISLVVVYLFGWAVSAIGCLLLGPEDEKLKGIDQRLVDWLDRNRK